MTQPRGNSVDSWITTCLYFIHCRISTIYMIVILTCTTLHTANISPPGLKTSFSCWEWAFFSHVKNSENNNTQNTRKYCPVNGSATTVLHYRCRLQAISTNKSLELKLKNLRLLSLFKRKKGERSGSCSLSGNPGDGSLSLWSRAERRWLFQGVTNSLGMNIRLQLRDRRRIVHF